MRWSIALTMFLSFSVLASSLPNPRSHLRRQLTQADIDNDPFVLRDIHSNEDGDVYDLDQSVQNESIGRLDSDKDIPQDLSQTSTSTDNGAHEQDTSLPPVTDHTNTKVIVKRAKQQHYGITEMQFKTPNIHWNEAVPPGTPSSKYGPCINRFFTEDINGIIAFDVGMVCSEFEGPDCRTDKGYIHTDGLAQHDDHLYNNYVQMVAVQNPQSFRCKKYVFGDKTINDNTVAPRLPWW